MIAVASCFSQLLCLIDRGAFARAVRKHQAERGAKGFSCWDQLVAMLFCQLGAAHSLREICGGLATAMGKLTHLGLSQAPTRSTLAYANTHRPWQLYHRRCLKIYWGSVKRWRRQRGAVFGLRIR